MFDVQPLSQLIERHAGGGTPSRSDSLFWGGNIPWASVKDFSDDSLELGRTQENITEAGLRASTSNLIPPGIPLVCTRMAVGRAAVASMPVAINQDVRALFPNRGTDPRYLLRLLAKLQARAEAQSVGSTVKGIRTSDYLSLEVPVAPSQEQPVIAEIIDTLDTQIRGTEALIAKLERIKQGLLTDLLTRGINQNGQLRPTPDQAPHLYKDSPLGWIPKEWRITSWDECTESWAMGPRFSAEKYTSDGNVATLRTTDMDSEGGINHSTMPIAKLDLRGLEQHVLKVGDFVITRSGTCGICGVFYGHSLPVLPGAFLIRFRFIASELDAEFMTMLMNSSVGNPLIARNAEGGVQKNLRGTSLVRITFPKPPVDEQMKIRRRVESVSERIAREKSELHKLRSKKVGLMDDLLTGQVRVTPLLEIKEQATA